ncbi:MAG: phage portal protein [Pseudomonadota bacterium]
MAARPDRLASGFAGALGLLPSQRQEVREDLRGLVGHARHAARNVDYMKAWEAMVRRHVIGHRGIQPAADCCHADGSPDPKAGKAILDAWKRWGKRGVATTCGRLSWWNLENIAATMVAREGNFLAQVRTAGPFGFQLKPLMIDQLDLDYVEELRDGGYVEGGVEFDADDRPRAFWFWDAHPFDTHGPARHRRRIRVPVGDLIHAWRPTEVAQVLGIPGAHTALRRLNMVGKYEEAALAAAHYGAAQMAIFESEDGDVADGSASGELPIDTIEAGMTAVLPAGMKLADWRPNYPDGEMPAFVAHMLRGAAAGLGVSYSGLANDLTGANFSSLRAGLGEERDEWRMFQRDLAETLHAQVFAAWLPRAIMAGEVRLPFTRIDHWIDSVTWRPRGWASVNPKDDATANDADLANRLRAPSDIVAERGGDFDETVRRIEADLETLRAAGLPVPRAMAQAQAQAQPPAPSPPREGGEEGGSGAGNDSDESEDT